MDSRSFNMKTIFVGAILAVAAFQALAWKTRRLHRMTKFKCCDVLYQNIPRISYKMNREHVNDQMVRMHSPHLLGSKSMVNEGHCVLREAACK
jgi:predicted negative regulator of RcsB-dependent stress response